MTNYHKATVIRLIGIDDPNLIESDNQFEIGTITLEVGPKVRIVWDGKNDPEFAFKSKLAKWDNGTFWLKPVNSWDSEAKFASPEQQHASVEAIENAMKGGEAAKTDKPVRRRTTPAKKDES